MTKKKCIWPCFIIDVKKDEKIVFVQGQIIEDEYTLQLIGGNGFFADVIEPKED